MAFINKNNLDKVSIKGWNEFKDFNLLNSGDLVERMDGVYGIYIDAKDLKTYNKAISRFFHDPFNKIKNTKLGILIYLPYLHNPHLDNNLRFHTEEDYIDKHRFSSHDLKRTYSSGINISDILGYNSIVFYDKVKEEINKAIKF